MDADVYPGANVIILMDNCDESLITEKGEGKKEKEPK